MVRDGLFELGFAQNQVKSKEEADYAQIDKLFADTKAEIDANWRDGEQKTLVYVYFGGHGVTDALTHAVCGKFAQNKPGQWTYPLELQLQKLAKRKGAYVVALMDCGRETWRINATANDDDDIMVK